MVRLTLLWWSTIALVLASSVRSQDLLPKSYVCYRASSPIRVDGALNEPSWQNAVWTDAFIDIEGSKRPLPRFRTKAKMLWDSAYFYVGAELQEPDVWATLLQRDTVIFRDDDFEVFVDPDGDTHEYYEFEMNAYNTVWDLLLVKPYRDGGPAINAWDIRGLQTAVQVRGTINKPGDVDSGWTVEIAFPWDVLRECAHKDAPPKSGDQWRLNFSRVEWRTRVLNGGYEKVIDPVNGRPYPEDNWVWSPQGLVNMHVPEMWGFIQFSEQTVGRGAEQFSLRAEERAKWALRKIYYREGEYFSRNGRFSADLNELGVDSEAVPGYAWPPDISCTPTMYEAVIHSVDGKARWHIRQDGKTWEQ